MIQIQIIIIHNNKLMSAVNDKIFRALKQKLSDNPNATELNLQFLQITDLLPLMQYLSKFKKLKKLTLHGNRLKQLPLDMSSLVSLEELDLSNNLLHDVTLDVMSLKTLPNLKILSYPVKKQKQMIVVSNIKTLTYFNNVQVVRNYSKEHYQFRYMNKQSLNKIHHELNNQYSRIEQLEKIYLDDEPDPSGFDKFSEQNHHIISQSLNKIEACGDDITQSLQLIVASVTKFELYDNLKMRTLNLCNDVYGDLGKFIKEICQLVAEQALKLAKFELETIEKVEEKMQNQGSSLENKIFAKNAKIEQELKRMKKQKDEYLSEINHLESENKRYLDLIVKYSRGEKANTGLNFISNHSTRTHAPIPTNIIKPLERPNKNQPISTIPSHNINQINNYMSGGSSRTLTLKQLKETIQQIYESKLKFDQKNFDGRIPRETMHQYLFTHLNQKYGLKNLTIEAASSIISGIQAYSSEDNDVAVFGKILRNQVDEQFRNVQTELKSTVNSLLKMHIKSQQPYKSTVEINQIFNEKINNQVTIEQTTDIVKYLYNKEDSERIMKKLQMLFKMNMSNKKQEHSHRRVPREEVHDVKSKPKIKFNVFLKTVLDFQLKNHEKLLKPLVRVFKAKDHDLDGIINEQEFIYVIEELCEEANEILPNLLLIIDPYETKSITFTQVVRLVANYPESNPILSRYIEDRQQEEHIDE